MPLIARLILGLVGDALLDATASRLRTHDAEIERYFADRGFRPATPTPVSRTK